MSYESRRNWGCIVSVTLFAIVGVPLLGLMSLGERECDVVKSHPCTIGWGWMQLVYLIAVVVACLGVGWLVNLAIRHGE